MKTYLFAIFFGISAVTLGAAVTCAQMGDKNIPEFKGYTETTTAADVAPDAGVAVPDPNQDRLTIAPPDTEKEYRPLGASGMDFRPKGVSGRDVAIAYHLLLGQQPDFRKWAMETDEYAKASDFDKTTVLEKKIKEYRDVVRLFTFADPLVIDTPVKLSEYHPGRQGFIVESFKEDTFFAFAFGGEHYAVVLPRLTDFQWMDVSPESADGIQKSLKNDKEGNMTMLIFIEPKVADRAPMLIGDRAYKLVSGDIRNMALYAHDSPRALWEKNSKIRDEKVLQELMNLYK